MTNLDHLKQEICGIGSRIYQKGFAAANDGNITYRVDEDRVLCTPTLHCKGFLTPDDICLVDMRGNQLAGAKKRSSEVLLHIEIMKARPEVKSVVHCHPPHATAFAVAREPIPQGVLPEVELFLGEVPIARYEAPGSRTFAETILPFVRDSNIILLANHGTVSYGEDVERAYWWTEVLDAYCRILILAKQVGNIEFLTTDQTRELLEIKQQKWGFGDARTEHGLDTSELCANALFRDGWEAAGVRRRGLPAHPSVRDEQAAPAGVDIETLVRTITARVVEELSRRG